MGLLVRGYQHRPAMGIPYNRDYYPALIGVAGFEPAGDLLSGYLSRDTPLPDRIHDVAEMIQRRRGLRVARIESRSDLRTLVPKLQALYNQSLGGTALLFSEMAKSVRKGRFLHADVVQIGAENERMLRELREIGIDFYKTHRMYRRAI